MATRSLNKVQLIGNLTRDPELRYTPSGTAVCSFGLATNRQWTTDAGEKKEEAEFHRILSWNKLAELCSQLLAKGRKVYVEGRLQTRTWQAQDGTQRTTTEIVISDMIILDSKRSFEERTAAIGVEAQTRPAPIATAGIVSNTPVSDSTGQSPAPRQVVTDVSTVAPVGVSEPVSTDKSVITEEPKTKKDTKEKKSKKAVKEEVLSDQTAKAEGSQDINPDDIPF